MTTEPRNPREHCRNAERALAALDVDDANTLAVTALVSAILATVPPRGAPRRAGERWPAPTRRDAANAVAAR
jgi:hypothetical protein